MHLTMQKDPKYYRAWTNKGLDLFDLELYDEDLEAFDKALEFDTKCEMLYMPRGFLYDIIGKYQDALECFDKALELDSSCFDACMEKV